MPFFLKAVLSGFYKDLAPIKYIIFDKQDNCRGYGTHALDSYKSEQNCLKGTRFNIKPIANQKKSYGHFIQLLEQRVLETGMVYFDLTMSNIVYDGETYFLIDLEPILDIESCRKNVCGFNRALKFNPSEYVAFIKKILIG